MKMTTLQTYLAVTFCLFSCSSLQAQIFARAGANVDERPSSVGIPFDDDHWSVDIQLIHDPKAAPMLKQFFPPNQDILPGMGFPVWERYPLLGDSKPVADWHEEFLEAPGWEWRLLPNESLITKNGQPHPHSPPNMSDPTRLWVDFPPIQPPDVLDIHKELFYAGHDFDGDGALDPWPIGRRIGVIEYPTPEPASMTLALFAVIGLFAATRQRR